MTFEPTLLAIMESNYLYEIAVRFGGYDFSGTTGIGRNVNDVLAVDQMFHQDPAVLSDPAWRILADSRLELLAVDGERLTRMRAVLVTIPPRYDAFQTWLDQIGQEILTMTAQYRSGIENSDPAQIESAGTSLDTILEHFDLAFEELGNALPTPTPSGSQG